MEYYQYFDDCFYTFNEVRFLGFFNYWDEEDESWIYCHERGEMDEDFNMTKPVTFTIGIYEEGEDGLPGKCVMQKDIDIIGEKTGVVLEGYGDEGNSPIYEFRAPLGQTINLEHGYIQINAKDMGDSPSCWFAVFTVGGNLTALQKDIINESYSGQNACAFCLYGDGSYNADKALQIERFMTPLSSASGKYEKVQVELTNIGKNAISDARLELYVDGVLVATEDVNATIEPFESYKYTFTARADCSGGKHVVTVKNVTPGDELKSYQSLSKTVEIGTTDLWIGVRMENIVATGYYIGVDEGPAVIGFGDLVNIGGNTWWSMADLGLDYNYCIRANVTGNRTPAISWLSTDKKSMEVAAGSEGKLNVSFTPQGLEEGVYEAYLEVSTNDPFNSFIRIPVYMVNGELTAIGSVEQEGLGITLNGGNVTIKGGKTIAALKVSDLTGRCLMTSKPGAEEATVSLSQFAKGVYVITATYADGKSVSVKVPALK